MIHQNYYLSKHSYNNMSPPNVKQPLNPSTRPLENEQAFDTEYDRLFTIQSSMKGRLGPLMREHRRLQANFLEIPEPEISDDLVDINIKKPAPSMYNLLDWRPTGNTSSSNEDEHTKNKPADHKQRNRMMLLRAIRSDIAVMEGEIREFEWRNRVLRERIRRRDVPMVIDLQDEPEERPLVTVEDREQAMEAIRRLARSLEGRRERNRDERYKTTVEEATDEDDAGGNSEKAEIERMVH